jgi:hypothetical protein
MISMTAAVGALIAGVLEPDPLIAVTAQVIVFPTSAVLQV